MGFKLIYAPEIYEDLQQNIDWYNERQSGLGSLFFKAVKVQITRIMKAPFGAAIRYEEVR